MLKKIIIVILTSIFLFSAHETTIAKKLMKQQKIRVLIMNNDNPILPGKDEVLENLGQAEGKVYINSLEYEGNVEIYKGKEGIFIINALPLEQYVKSVVMSEVTKDWDYEALKAQAVIVRTYAINHILKKRDALYHLTSSTLHQIYKGNNFNDITSRAVDETSKEILTYNGKPIIAYYHSTCGGKTELPEEVFGNSYPYLKSVENDCNLSPLSIWERRIPFSELERVLHIPHIKNIGIYSYTKTGRVKIMKILSDRNVTYIEAKELRRVLGWRRVPSTMFKILNSTFKNTLTSFNKNTDKPSSKILILEGRGYGHGVGLCQWGTLQMVRDGKTYREILSHYYHNTEIKPYTSTLNKALLLPE